MPGEAAGAAAFAQRQWSRAYEELAEAEQQSGLSAMELDRFGLVTHLLGREAEGDQLWERAHRAYLDMDNPPAAARVAFWLAIGHMERGEMAQAGGWLARAGRILGEIEIDCSERGYIRIPEGLQLLEARDPGAGLAWVDQRPTRPKVHQSHVAGRPHTCERRCDRSARG